jgi:RNA-directed DNA polymerase
VVEGAVKLVLEPIFEADFQEGSYGYRPNRSTHQALERVRVGLIKGLRKVIDLDLRSYFDSVRHDLMLSKIAKRVRDKDLLWLCKGILKSGGKRGLPQGSVVGPLWANVFLNAVDLMLEHAQIATKRDQYETVRYTRFADDLVVLVYSDPRAAHWVPKVERRLREEFKKLDLEINEEKTRVVKFEAGEPFDFLGYTFRWVTQRKDPGKKMVQCRPQKKKRTRFLRELSHTLRRRLHVPVEEVVQQVVNPRVRGWVNHFRWGNSGWDLRFVGGQVEMKVRRFASRQRPKRGKCGRGWTTWSKQVIYGDWKLYSDYRVAWCSVPSG